MLIVIIQQREPKISDLKNVSCTIGCSTYFLEIVCTWRGGCSLVVEVVRVVAVAVVVRVVSVVVDIAKRAGAKGTETDRCAVSCAAFAEA